MNDVNWLEPVIIAYKKYFNGDANKIVDVGSRDGDDADWIFKAIGEPDSCEVICIEARDDAAKEIQDKYPSFTVISTAISDFIGESKFIKMTDPDFLGSSSLMPERKKAYPANSVNIHVPVTTLEQILSSGTIDILKIDIEGYSVQAIRGMGERIKDVLVAHIETETPERRAWGEPSNNLEVAKLMQEAGFSLFDVSYQWGWSIQDQTWLNVNHERYREL